MNGCAVSPLHDHVHFRASGGTQMAQRRLGFSPGDLLAEFSNDKRFQHPPQQRSVLAQPSGVHADEMAGEPGIYQTKLRRLDQPLSEIGRPRRQTMNQKHRLE